MVQVLLPVRLLQEAVACAVLGAALGVVRAFLPVRGRAAFMPDVLLSGAVLLACQSYVQQSGRAAVVHGAGILCSRPLHRRGAGHPVAGTGAGDRRCFAPARPYFAPFCGAAPVPPPRCG